MLNTNTLTNTYALPRSWLDCNTKSTEVFREVEATFKTLGSRYLLEFQDDDGDVKVGVSKSHSSDCVSIASSSVPPPPSLERNEYATYVLFTRLMHQRRLSDMYSPGLETLRGMVKEFDDLVGVHLKVLKEHFDREELNTQVSVCERESNKTETKNKGNPLTYTALPCSSHRRFPSVGSRLSS